MSLSNLLHAIERDLPRYTRSYSFVRRTVRELSPYETPLDVRLALHSPTCLSAEERGLLVIQLIREAQKPSASPVWSSLLTLHFAPTLRMLRTRTGDARNVELDSALLVAFFAAVRLTPMGPSFSASFFRAIVRELPDVGDEPPPHAFESFDENRHGIDLFGVAARAAEADARPFEERLRERAAACREPTPITFNRSLPRKAS